MARDYLRILAISALSKCVFSVRDNIITKKRNKLGADNTRKTSIFTGLGCFNKRRG